MRLFEFSGIRITDGKLIEGDYTYEPPLSYDGSNGVREQTCVHMINEYPCLTASIKLIKGL